MAVQEQTPLQEYTANGIAKQFDLEFDCESADHLIVSIDDLEVLHTDWYLSGNAIMFHVAPANGKQVKIQRNTPYNRLADYQSYNNSFRPPAINKDFDRIWWKLQELGVADWILHNRIDALKAYVDQQDSELQQNIDNLKIYVDDKDNELRAYLTEEIRKQGVALDQLDDYCNYLMQRLAQIAVDKGWDASFVVDASGKTQQELNSVSKTFFNYNPKSDASVDEKAKLEAYLATLPLNPIATHTPKGFANGGIIRIPRGRFKFTSPIKLKRGTRIEGESKEATQLICASLNGLFVFEDDGGYIPDEISLSNLSIWQDESVTPTSGAALTVAEGTYTTAIQFKLENVHIEGTYKGFEAISGIGCTLIGVTTSKCISHGIDINNKGNNAKSTTSTSLLNCYSFLNGGNGVNVVGSSYVSLIGTASDSNTGYGYKIVGANTINLIGVGAERNSLGNAYMKDVTSANLSGHFITQTGAVNGITLNNVSGLTALGTNLFADTGNTGNAIHFEATPRIVTFIGGYIQNFANKSNNLNNVLFLSGQAGSGLIRGGDTSNWTFGEAVAVDRTAQIANVGTVTAGVIHGFKNSITYASAGANFNTAMFNQVITAATSVTYPLVVGSYIENAFLGSGSTVTRSAGQYIKEQTRGLTANANLMIDGGQGTIPVGQWSIYNGSAKANYHGGSMTWKPAASATPSNNGDLTFELTSNTELKIKVRGDDGVLRGVTLTLA